MDALVVSWMHWWCHGCTSGVMDALLVWCHGCTSGVMHALVVSWMH